MGDKKDLEYLRKLKDRFQKLGEWYGHFGEADDPVLREIPWLEVDSSE